MIIMIIVITIYIYIHTYIYTYSCVYIYIYIYREREIYGRDVRANCCTPGLAKVIPGNPPGFEHNS